MVVQQAAVLGVEQQEAAVVVVAAVGQHVVVWLHLVCVQAD